MSSSRDISSNLPARVIQFMNTIMAERSPKDLDLRSHPKHPPIFIAGTPRSGSTLLMQLVAYFFDVAYINNLHARFWKNPLMGAALAAKIQGFGSAPNISFESKHGVTPGYEGPHEFGYFWRRWFTYEDSHQLNAEEKERIDKQQIRRAWGAMDTVFDRSIAHKNGAALSLNIDLLSKVFPDARFIHCRREPMFAVQSLLESRAELGNHDEWISTKPPQYKLLKKLSVEEQCAGQIYFVREAIENQLEGFPDEQWTEIKYKHYCQQPRSVLEAVKEQLDNERFNLSIRALQPPTLECSNEKRVDDETWQTLRSAWKNFSSQ